MLRITIVKTWCENTEEGENYLKYNNYGVVKRIFNSSYFICFNSKNHIKLNDVKLVFEI